MSAPDDKAQIEAQLACLRLIPAFAALSDPQLSGLALASSAVDYAEGERLMGQGDASDFALILLSGAVSIVNESHHGPSPLARVSAPALVGEIGALAQLRRTASVLAATPVHALRVERDVLMRACRHSPDILVSVIGQLGQQIQNVNAALGLYANGLAALKRGDIDPTILQDLNNPTEEAREFAAAFQSLARHITLERRQRDEMASAALIQRSMLPRDPGSLPLQGRCDVFGRMTPARDVGGDFYDVFMLDADRLVLIVGDVCGKGVPASLFMSVTMTALRLAARERASVQEMVETANAMLCAQNPTLMFATMVYGVLDLRDGGFEYASCGHNPPYILRSDAGCVPLPTGGPPLGLVPGKRFASRSIRLRRGDGLFLFTDGVTEGIDPSGAEFGDERLARTLDRQAGVAASTLVEAVMADVAAFAAGAEPFDDVTCLAARLS